MGMCESALWTGNYWNTMCCFLRPHLASGRLAVTKMVCNCTWMQVSDVGEGWNWSSQQDLVLLGAPVWLPWFPITIEALQFPWTPALKPSLTAPRPLVPAHHCRLCTCCSRAWLLGQAQHLVSKSQMLLSVLTTWREYRVCHWTPLSQAILQDVLEDHVWSQR